MKAVYRFIAAHNIVPILITFICFRFFYTLHRWPTDHFLTFGASFCCWAFYWMDKLRDNRNKVFAPTDRHYQSTTDKVVQGLIGIILLWFTLSCYHPVSIYTFVVFSIAIPISFFYLMIANSQRKIAKEIFSSLIISITLCLAPILLNGDNIELVYFPLFFMMVFGNLLILGIVEKEYDLKHQFNSISINNKEKNVITVLCILMLLIVLLAIVTGRQEAIIWAFVYCTIYIVILFSRKKADLNLLHLMADSVFLTPYFLTFQSHIR